MFLRNYFIGFLKESGFVRFAHSILFNFQVPHSALPFGSRRCLADSLFILPQRFPFVKGFLKIFPRRLRLPKPFQVSLTPVTAGFAAIPNQPVLAATCISYHSWRKMSTPNARFVEKCKNPTQSAGLPGNLPDHLRFCCRYSSGDRPVWRLKTCEK